MTRSSRSPVVQTLEARRLLAVSIIDRVLTIHGTDFRDNVRVEIGPVELRVRMISSNDAGPTDQSVPLRNFDAIRIKTFGDKDLIEFWSSYSRKLLRSGGNLNQPLYIHAGAGADTILIRPGLFAASVHIFAQGGDDRIEMPNLNPPVRSPLKTFVYGHAGNDTIQVRYGMLRAWGGSGNDTITGGPQTDILYGDGGDDVIDAGRGNATIHGGTGDDDIRARDGILDLRGGHGRDKLYAYGPKSLLMYGGADDDELRVSGPIWGATLLDGGRGHDRLNASMATGHGISLIGGGSGDTLIGSPYDDNFYGQGGRDWIYRMGGTDYIDPDDDVVIT
jgi:Ca2+-binding RTX toxin-like protein